METPYVVRSHAASQTHKEQECWTFTHPHLPSKPTAIDTDGPQQNLSACATKNINNDRHAHLSFGYEPTHGAVLGCGYGAVDSEMLAMASVFTDDESSSSADDTTLTLHGFLGTFHSVLYESKDKTKLSTISIAPHSFSVGMFSWFPLVSTFFSHSLLRDLYLADSKILFLPVVFSAERAPTRSAWGICGLQHMETM